MIPFSHGVARLVPMSARILTMRLTRTVQTVALSRKEGDISSVFASLSGDVSKALPSRFTNVKRKLIQGREEVITKSWKRLLEALEREVKRVETLGSSIIPSIQYSERHNKFSDFKEELKKRGVGVVRGVIPEDEARAYKDDLEEYIKANPSTKGFPATNPAVFELYWSPSQIRARSHPHMLETQRLLMQTWHSNDHNSLIACSRPVTYADRLRIRQPGDAGFALGPHVDGGSVERWEEGGYGASRVYTKIWAGEWEKYDPWEASCRLRVNADLYGGPGACSMFRMFQGWLGMSWTGPGEGTLLVNPMLRLATAYYLLRPFFVSVRPAVRDERGNYTVDYLEQGNWRLQSCYEPVLQGAMPGLGQELSEEMHPHLQLSKAMVHIPKIAPGDYVVWHCDSIHAVDKVHRGATDSSVLYIPVCPLTERNAQCLTQQRETFLQGSPGPDFPGGPGESNHIGRATPEYLKQSSERVGVQAMGLQPWSDEHNVLEGEGKMLSRANEILGF